MKKNIEQKLLATHIANNPDFEVACMNGDVEKIMSIVVSEMEKNNLFTKGSIKLRDDIFRLTRGKSFVSASVGGNILSFVWNAKLSGIGLGVI